MHKTGSAGQAVKIVNIHEAKTHLSRLLSRVMAGEQIIIAKAGKPVARMVPAETGRSTRVPGTAKGKLSLSRNFEKPLPEKVLRSFEK